MQQANASIVMYVGSMRLGKLLKSLAILVELYRMYRTTLLCRSVIV